MLALSMSLLLTILPTRPSEPHYNYGVHYHAVITIWESVDARRGQLCTSTCALVTVSIFPGRSTLTSVAGKYACTREYVCHWRRLLYVPAYNLVRARVFREHVYHL